MPSESSIKDKVTPRPTGVTRDQLEQIEKDSRKSVSLDTKLQERLVQFDAVVTSSRELFEEKNAQYADSISRTGVIGSVVAIAGLSARLEHLVLASSDAGKGEEEAVVDVVKDILNYAAITGIMIMSDNWRPQ